MLAGRAGIRLLSCQGLEFRATVIANETRGLEVISARIFSFRIVLPGIALKGRVVAKCVEALHPKTRIPKLPEPQTQKP